MPSPVEVSDVRLLRGSSSDAMTGLLGRVELTLNGALRLTGLTLRRPVDGRLTLSFPSRRDRQGRDHPLVRPLDSAARAAIERQVLAALGLDEGATP